MVPSDRDLVPSDAVRGVKVPEDLHAAPHESMEVSYARRPPEIVALEANGARFFWGVAAVLQGSPHLRLASQEYVRARLLQFSRALAGRIAPNMTPQMVHQAALDALRVVPPPDYSGAALATRDLQLVFRHDCL